MKVIDLLNKIANGEEVPKIIYDNKMYAFDEKCNWFEDFSNGDVMTVFRIGELNQEIEVVKIIEDTPKEDKKIEKIKDYSIMTTMGLDGELQKRKISKAWELEEIVNKINEIIDKVNGDDNE